MFSSVCNQRVACHTVWKHCLSRQYAKGLKRKPLKVFSVSGEELTDKAPVEKQPLVDRRWHQQDEQIERNILGDMEYTWLKNTDKRLKLLRSVTMQRNTRAKKGTMALEGRRMVADALKAQANIKSIYFSRVETLEELDLTGLEGRLFKVKHSQLEYVTGVTTPPGVMALVEMPVGGTLKSVVDPDELRPITLILDNIRDPGNMGTLLRSANAVGCHKILVTSGNVDIWDPKVLRAGAGCHFRTHIRQNLKWPMIHQFLSEECTLLLADNRARHGQYDSPTDSDTESSDDASSLNRGSIPTGGTITGGESNTVDVVDAYSVNIGSASEVAVVVGGETHGLSDEAYEVMRERGGNVVRLPMVTGVDSLNAAMAGSVLMYEVRRQMDVMRKIQNRQMELEMWKNRNDTGDGEPEGVRVTD